MPGFIGARFRASLTYRSLTNICAIIVDRFADPVSRVIFIVAEYDKAMFHDDEFLKHLDKILPKAKKMVKSVDKGNFLI